MSKRIGTAPDGGGPINTRWTRSEAVFREHAGQDVMDLARLGAGEFRLDPAEVDLGDVLREAAKAHASRAAGAGVSLEAEPAEQLILTTDAMRVRQIVSNLVENALRVTPAGGGFASPAKQCPVRC